jgi:N-acetyl-1-D-myo-inositol-2-amino-2-deoxy-alpha-D-glucopyranoside deacetylase
MDATTLPPDHPPADESPEPLLGGAEEALLDEQAYEVLAEAAAVVEPMEQLVDMEALDRSRRLILVHAHPDDETIATGATMAKYAAEGALVTLVTCTRGEEGEIVVSDLAHMSSADHDRLGEHRVEELATACEALGVRDFRFLGGAGRFRDSGMMGESSNEDPRCFWRADLDEATRDLVGIVRDVRPQVMVTYDENGFYGHPDHIRANQVAVRALDAAADARYAPELGEPWQISKLYYSTTAKSFIQAGIDAFREAGRVTEFFEGVTTADELGFGVDDDDVTTQVDGREYFDAKVAALRAHRSQVAVDGMFFALADGVGQRAWAVEQYILVRGAPGPAGADGREDDLFAGLAAPGHRSD